MTREEMRRQLAAACRQLDSELPDWPFVCAACIAVYKGAQVAEARSILQKRPETEPLIPVDQGGEED